MERPDSSASESLIPSEPPTQQELIERLALDECRGNRHEEFLGNCPVCWHRYNAIKAALQAAAPVSEEIAKLRDLIAEHRWQLGFAGGANIVRFTDSNIVGIGTAAQPDALIEAHNSALDQVDAFLSALQQEKP